MALRSPPSILPPAIAEAVVGLVDTSRAANQSADWPLRPAPYFSNCCLVNGIDCVSFQIFHLID